MKCLCGQEMILLGKIIMVHKLTGVITVYACPPDGCGRVYMDGNPHGTWYLPEQNEKAIIS